MMKRVTMIGSSISAANHEIQVSLIGSGRLLTKHWLSSDGCDRNCWINAFFSVPVRKRLLSTTSSEASLHSGHCTQFDLFPLFQACKTKHMFASTEKSEFQDEHWRFDFIQADATSVLLVGHFWSISSESLIAIDAPTNHRSPDD